MNKTWHLAKLFYPIDVARTDDATGDSVLTKLARPLFHEVMGLDIADAIAFMRFSKQGSHVRMRFRVDDARYGDFENIVQQRVQGYVHTHPALFARPMQLSPVGQVINAKMQGGAQQLQAEGTSALRNPGELLLVADELDQDQRQGFYERDDVETTEALLQHLTCTALLDFLQLNPSLEARKAFVRLFMMNMFGALALTPYDVYRIAGLLRTQWTSYFELDSYMTAYFDRYHKERARYDAFIQSGMKAGARVPGGVLNPKMSDVLNGFMNQLRHLCQNQPLVVRDTQNALTGFSVLRLFGFFHLNHNRLGIGIFQEVFWAYAMAEYFGARLSSLEQNRANQWAQDVAQVTAA